MKKILISLQVIAAVTFLFIGCGKESSSQEDQSSKQCIFTDEMLVLEPICSFDPSQATTVSFPVRVLVEGIAADKETYEFNWSTDSNFHGSAISVSYEQLPLVAIITEISTGCIAEVTLESNYWD